MSAIQRFLNFIFLKRVYVWLTVVFIFLLGLGTYRGIQVDLFPPLNFPILNVITEAQSFSSLEMERQITLPIESAVGGVMGVTKVRSVTATGISMVSAEFQWGTDMLLARQYLNEALGTVKSQLPPNTESTIENLSAALSMMEGYSFQGGTDYVKLRDMAVKDLKPRLQRIPGVYKVAVMGGKTAEYSVRLNPALMIKFDITLDNVRDALSTNNVLASPGILNHFSQEFVIHANGQFENIESIEEVVIAVKSGYPVRVKDVAKVRSANQYERGDTSERGSPAVLINIYKQPNFDSGSLADAIKNEVETYQSHLPKEFSLRNYYDQAELIRDSIGSVKESVWIGAILVIVVLAAFLGNFKSTIIATTSIPISVVTALVLMRGFGMSLNIMSLGGLAIGTGIIVDDTIVVLENIFRWFSSKELRKELGNREIIIAATSEVFRPVFFSTLTNIGIFAPMILIEGFAGRLFSPVSFTVTFALVASLIVALSIIPLLAAKFLTDVKHHEEEGGIMHRTYGQLLNKALLRPKRTMLFGLIPVLLVFIAFRSLNVEFLPALDEGAILLNVAMPAGTSLAESQRVGQKLENWVKDLPGVITATRRTGHAPGSEDTDSVNHSDIMVKLVPKHDRPISLEKMIEGMKAQTTPLVNVQVNYLMPLADKIGDALGGVPAELGIDLFGPDLEELHKYADLLVVKIHTIKGIRDLRPPEDIPIPSMELAIDKKEAGRLGIAVKNIYDVLQAYSDGVEATTVRELQKEIPVTLHFSGAGENFDQEALNGLPLRTTTGGTVPLEQIAKFSFADLPSEILHEHQSRKLTVTANVSGRNTHDVAMDIKSALEALKLPAGYSWGFSGKYATQESALFNMGFVLFLAICVVAFILWIEFQSLKQVGLVLLTIPLAGVGAFISLWICHETINVSSMIGAVMLVGIVVRNGIMLLDYMNMQMENGVPLREAVVSSAMKRVRPILMTASVTILGLVPLAVGWGAGAELQRPLAIAVIGGILISTLLTLLILPAGALLLVKEDRRRSNES